MAVVKPFRALRYDERRAGPLPSLVSQPYDVIGPEQRAAYFAASPYNVVRLTLPESEEQSAADLAAWRAGGVLVRDETPALWWLVQEFTGPDGVARTRTGIVASVGVEPYETRTIRPHERTHRGPKEGRLRLLRATRTQLEPIFLLYDDPEQAPRRALEPLAQGAPTLEATDGGVTSRLWRVDDPQAIAQVEAALAPRHLLIADGHHRYETAVAFHEEDGTSASAFTLAVLVNATGEGLTIFPTHRVFARKPAATFLGAPRHSESPQAALATLDTLPRDYPSVALYEDGRTSIVTAPELPGQLDAELVDALGHEGISYTPRWQEAVAAVDSGAAELALLMRPPLIEEVERVAAEGRVMPQKSTYFFPKLHSGLLFHPLE